MTEKIQWGPVHLIERQVPNTTIWSRQSIAGEGDAPNAQTLCSWSSGTPDGTITQTIIGVHDSPSPNASQWAQYFELWALKGSHPNGTVFTEMALINQRGSCADINPYYINPPGQFTGPRIGVGKPGYPAGEVSALGTFVNVEGANDSLSRLGLVFDATVLKMYSGIKAIPRAIGRAICLARDQAIQWYDQWGRPSSMIVCDTSNADHGVCIRLSDDTIHFGSHANGWDHFSFNCETGALYLGSGALGPNSTIRVFVAGRPYLLKAVPE